MRLDAQGVDLALQLDPHSGDVRLELDTQRIDVGLQRQALVVQVGFGGEMRRHVALHGIDDGPGLVVRDVDADQSIVQGVEKIH